MSEGRGRFTGSLRGSPLLCKHKSKITEDRRQHGAESVSSITEWGNSIQVSFREAFPPLEWVNETLQVTQPVQKSPLSHSNAAFFLLLFLYVCVCVSWSQHHIRPCWQQTQAMSSRLQPAFVMLPPEKFSCSLAPNTEWISNKPREKHSTVHTLQGLI